MLNYFLLARWVIYVPLSVILDLTMDSRVFLLASVFVHVYTQPEDNTFGKIPQAFEGLIRFINASNTISFSRIQCASYCKVLDCSIWKYINVSNECLIGHLGSINHVPKEDLLNDTNPEGNYFASARRQFGIF